MVLRVERYFTPCRGQAFSGVLAVPISTWTASRVQQCLETVLDWIVAEGWRRDNPAGKSILRVLPRISRLKGYHTVLPYGDVPDALRRVRESTAGLVTRLSFEFLVLTASRSSEVRLATWERWRCGLPPKLKSRWNLHLLGGEKCSSKGTCDSGGKVSGGRETGMG